MPALNWIVSEIAAIQAVADAGMENAKSERRSSTHDMRSRHLLQG
jgi:hypothetical protein